VKPGVVGRHAAAYAGVRYLDAVHRAGAVGLVVAPRVLTPDDAADLLASVHGLLLIGGQDVDPALYGEPRSPEVYGVRRLEDDFEIILLRAAMEQGLPVLAVCRGAQVLNVALGGTLHQHISDDPGLLPHARTNFPEPEPGANGPLQEITVQPGCRLADALGATITNGAHSHHQAANRLGDGLVVTARSADGVIEGFEHEHGWVVGVQWHPEDTADVDPVQQRLFDTFVAQARAQAAV